MAANEVGYAQAGGEADDDLPRAFRREKEARAREAQKAAGPSLPMPGPGAEARTGVAAPARNAPNDPPPVMDMPFPSVVRRFDVPFAHLVMFFLKCVVAAVPAVILLSAILWILGAGLSALFPSLLKMKILIGVGS